MCASAHRTQRTGGDQHACLSTLFRMLAAAGRRVVEAPLLASGDTWVFDLDRIRRVFADGARIFIICNPQNPTGRVFTREELIAVVELAAEFDVVLFSDEIHGPLVLPGANHVPLLSLGAEAEARGISFVSASKGWNIPGLKCAQAVVASERLRCRVRGIFDMSAFAIGNLGVMASIAAYRDSVAWLDSAISIIDANRWRMHEFLAAYLPTTKYTPPQGGYFAWIDCATLDLEPDPAEVFLEYGRVALHSGSAFGAPGGGWVRATMATSPELLEDVVRRMAAATTLQAASRQSASR
jgi:cystathionine beta-lyase